MNELYLHQPKNNYNFTQIYSRRLDDPFPLQRLHDSAYKVYKYGHFDKCVITKDEVSQYFLYMCSKSSTVMVYEIRFEASSVIVNAK